LWLTSHYTRRLRELRSDLMRVLSEGRIVRSRGPQLADELESIGYAEWAAGEG
jgi:Fe-S cluster assembly ATP-binding protein